MKEFAKASAISVDLGQRRGGAQSGSQIVSYLFLRFTCNKKFRFIYYINLTIYFPCFSGFHLTDYLTA